MSVLCMSAITLFLCLFKSQLSSMKSLAIGLECEKWGRFMFWSRNDQSVQGFEFDNPVWYVLTDVTPDCYPAN